MIPHEERLKFLRELAEVPIISVVCRRLGIGKATFYRWMENKRFKKKVEKAQSKGREGMNDVCEGQTITLVKKGDFRAIKFWLENNCKRSARPKPKDFFDPPYKGVRKITYEIVDRVDPAETKPPPN